jgi:hypothetical protein
VIIGLKHQNEQFFSYIKAMKQKEFKAPIIYRIEVDFVFAQITGQATSYHKYIE